MKLEFRPFIKVEGVTAKEFRQERINILDHTGIIFTSRTAIDHFFRICQEMRITVPDTMKYFCISEATAFYLQKYIVYRKRKIFYGDKKVDDMTKILQKHKTEHFLVPLSDIHKENIPDLLDRLKLKYTKAILYKTVASNLSDIKDLHEYDIIAFYTTGNCCLRTRHRSRCGRSRLATGHQGAYPTMPFHDHGTGGLHQTL